MCVALYQSRFTQTFAVRIVAFKHTRPLYTYTIYACTCDYYYYYCCCCARSRGLVAPCTYIYNIMPADMIIYNKRRPSGWNIYNIRLVDVGFLRDCFTPTNSDAVPDLCRPNSTRALHTRVTYGSLRKSFEGN